MKLYDYLESITDYTENPNPNIQDFIRKRLSKADHILRKVRFLEQKDVLIQKIRSFFTYFNRLSRIIKNLKVTNSNKYSEMLDAHTKNLYDSIKEYESNIVDETTEKNLDKENIKLAKEVFFNIIYIYFIMKSFFRKNSDINLLSNSFTPEAIDAKLADFFDDDHVMIKEIFPNIEKYVFNFPKINANKPSRILIAIKKDNKKSDENKKIIQSKQFYFFHCLNYDDNVDINNIDKLEYSTVQIKNPYDDFPNKGNITYFDFYVQEGKEDGKYVITDTAFIFPNMIQKLNQEQDKNEILNLLYKVNKEVNVIKTIKFTGKTIIINNMSKILQNKVKFSIPIGFKLGNIIIN